MNPFGELESAAKSVGHGIGDIASATGNAAGDVLNAVGAHGLANDVKGLGDKAAFALGDAPVVELGETSDPKELIPGEPDALRQAASKLGKFSAAFGETADGLHQINTSHWEGAAADAFRAKFSPEPAKWTGATEAMSQARAALESYAESLEAGQAKAQQAIDLWQRGQDATQKAQNAYNQQVAQYNNAVMGSQFSASRGPLPAKPGPFQDPGESLRNEAQQVLSEARSSVNGEASRANAELSAAEGKAPAQPSFLTKLKDEGESALLQGASFSSGAVSGVAGLVKMAAPFSPQGMAYNVQHPYEAASGQSAELAGLVGTAVDPTKLVKTAGSGLHSFAQDPANGLGKLTPNVALAVGTAGAGTAVSAGSTALEAGTEATVETAGETGAETAGEAGAEGTADAGDSAAAQNPATECTTPGDPVNVATGEVVFAGHDVVVEGPLPLMIERMHQSQRRGGRWLGEQWASTFDQRLLVTPDRIGAVFADGRSLFWPVPGPGEGAGVLPVAGPAWPLRRDPDGGGYEVTDRQQGLTWRYEWHEGFYRGGENLGELPLVSVTDRVGRQIVFSYTSGGAPEAITHSAGLRVTVATEDGRVRSVSAGETRLAEYYYDEAGDLTAVLNSSGDPMRFGYDEAGRLTEWTDRLGNSYRYTYDEDGRCVRGESPSGMQSAEFAYETGRTRWTDATGAVTSYEIDDKLRITAVTDPLGNITRTEYDARGRKTAITDPLGQVTRYAYDDAGNLTGVTRPDGTVSTVEYDAECRPVRLTGPDGSVHERSYDERGNPVEVTGPDGGVTRYAYDERGHLASVTDPDGAVTATVCDAAGLPVRVTGPDGEVTSYERDAFGRITRITGPDGGVTALGWDTEGRLISRTLPDGLAETWEWDADGHEIRHVAPSGAVTSQEYGPFDVLTAVTGPDGRRSEYGYDAELRITSVTHGELTWHYSYDPAGRLTAETDFNGATTNYRNGPTGLRVSKVNAVGQETTYAYDALGNLVSVSADGAETVFEYDPAGRLIRARNDAAEIAITRDPAGRVTAETCNGRSVGTRYDAAGRVAGRTTPSGAVTDWTYDAAGRPVTMSRGGREIRFGYGPGGREIRRDLPGGAVLAQDWDAAGRLASQVLTGPGEPSPLQHRTYAYSPDGFVTGLEDILAGPRLFGLDAAGRVLTVTGPGWDERYAYDQAGNVVSASWPAAPEGRGTPWLERGPQGPRTADGTRITRAGQFAYHYDAAGRVTSRIRKSATGHPDIWRYQWDADNRLVAVETPDGGIWRYLYDPLGRRVSKQRRGPGGRVLRETLFAWDGQVLAEQAEVIGEREHIRTWDYQPGTFTPVAQSAGGTIDGRFWAIVSDLTGVPSEMVAADGTLAGTQRHTLWGGTSWEPGGARTPLRFPGQYADDETGLHYNNQRYYDPVTGAYLTPDPLGLAPAPNPHAYVPNPHILTDPLGLSPCNLSWSPGQNLPRNVNLGMRYDPNGPPTMFDGGSMTKADALAPDPDSVWGSKGDFIAVKRAGDPNSLPARFYAVGGKNTEVPLDKLISFAQKMRDSLPDGAQVPVYVNKDGAIQIAHNIGGRGAPMPSWGRG